MTKTKRPSAQKEHIFEMIDQANAIRAKMSMLMGTDLECIPDDYTHVYWTFAGAENDGINWAITSDVDVDPAQLDFEYGAEVWGSVTKKHGFTLAYLDHGSGGGPELAIFDNDRFVK